MTNEAITTTGLQRRPPVEQPLYAPLSSPAVFWRPRHLAPSPMLGQVPYLFWLMDILRPRSITQIGLGDGVVYMALCQAAERLGGQTLLTGLAGPEDDTHALLPDPFLERHAVDYADVSTLATLPLDQAARCHGAGLDLLVLNAPLEAADAEVLSQHWLPGLSDRAAILICQPDRVLTDGGLGHDSLRLAGPMVLTGPNAPGRGHLDVILHGERQPERLLALTDGAGDIALRTVARQVFGRLGQGLQDALEVETLQSQHRHESRAHAEARHQLQALRAALQGTEARLARVEANCAALSDQRAAAVEAHSADIARLCALRDEIAELKASLQGHDRQLDDLRQLKHRYATRLDDIAALTQDAERQREGDLAEIAELQQKLVARERTLQAEKEEVTRLARRVRMLESSTSWRVTQPLRAIKQLFSGSGAR